MEILHSTALSEMTDIVLLPLPPLICNRWLTLMARACEQSDRRRSRHPLGGG